MRFKLLTPLVLLFLFSNCANYKLNYSNTEENWESNKPDGNLDIKHTMYLIGDAGNVEIGARNYVLDFLKTKLDASSEHSSVIYLGDNIYPVGLPPKSEKVDRKKAEHALDIQLNAVKDFKGRPIIIPGNHDWAKYGLKGLRRQEKYVEKRLNEGIEDEDDWENYFFPDRGCGGPEIVELEDDLVVVVIDSNWWLRDWDKDTEINDGCEAKSRFLFGFLFEETLRKYRNKNVVVAMHHPMFSNGPHGGYFTIKQHLFPLTDLRDGLYIPFPGLGSLFAFLRGTVGSKQDIAHQSYKDMRDKLLNAAKKNGNFIFAAGHEHTLQYFERDRQNFIVSGAGSKMSPAKVGNEALFAYGHKGFSQIDFYTDGSAWMQFWVPNLDGKTGKVVYRKKIKEKLSISEDNIPSSFPEYDAKKKTIETFAINNPVESKGGFYNFLLGKHYRTLYQQKYEFPVLDLATYKGGLTPIKRGGGNQTNSLRLENPEGKEYNMRALTKDASRLLPYPFNKMTAAKDIVITNFLSTHIFAPLAIPVLADVANVYHTNPELYYIPKQPRLDVHNDLFGGGVYLVEERPAKDWSDLSSFGNSSKIISTPDLVDKLSKNHKHKVDERWAVRSRLFDLIIGDWDRHDDQWRWASFEQEDGTKLYRPIPRDRDQPFSKYDGVFTGFANLTMPFLRQLKTYQEDIPNMKWHSWSSRYFDESFTGELTWEDWEAEAKFLKENITDEVIEDAIATWPAKAQELTGEEIKRKLRGRRDRVVEFARQLYILAAKRVDVVGTDDRELFKIERLDNERTRVRVWELSKKGNQKDQVYDRTFLASETKEIHFYGQGDDDVFEVSGEVKNGILIRLVGGLDDDEFIDHSKVSGGKKTFVYDNLEDKNKLDIGPGTKDKRSNRRELNLYNRKDYHYEHNFMIPFPILGFNEDNGFLIGADLLFTRYQFKKSPYGQTHRVVGTFATATLSPELKYTGDFINGLGNWDFLFNAELRGSRSSFNFFDLGNTTPKPPEEKDFNRVRQELILISPAAKKTFAGGSGQFTVGPFFERSKIEDTPDRFIFDYAEQNPNEKIFDSKIYSGLKIGLNFENLDNTMNTHRGIKFHTSLSWRKNLEESGISNTLLRAGLAFYTPIDPAENLIFASQIGFGRIWGDYEFFQAPVLGGGAGNLRGYRFDRFRGDIVFYHNLDLRMKLFSSVNRVVPFSFGLHAGFDYGRVWLDGEDSEKWHNGYGGGIWIAPIDYIILSLGLYHSDEDDRFVFTVGYSF